MMDRLQFLRARGVNEINWREDSEKRVNSERLAKVSRGGGIRISMSRKNGDQGGSAKMELWDPRDKTFSRRSKW